jgi:hypothetical protein
VKSQESNRDGKASVLRSNYENSCAAAQARTTLVPVHCEIIQILTISQMSLSLESMALLAEWLQRRGWSDDREHRIVLVEELSGHQDVAAKQVLEQWDDAP